MERKSKKRVQSGFTLIELLIVVAIIAILAAIAVPNFLEAQTRSKVARAVADMRSIATAVEAYNVDWNTDPQVIGPSTDLNAPGPPFPHANVPVGCSAHGSAFSAWWGFIGPSITTPVAYMTSIPTMAFRDEQVVNFWINFGGNEGNQPYTMIRAASTAANWQPGQTYGGNLPTVPFPVPISEEFHSKAKSSGYIIYTSGPDGVDATVYGKARIYDPTNGTVSFGDVYRFGGGQTEREKDLCK